MALGDALGSGEAARAEPPAQGRRGSGFKATKVIRGGRGDLFSDERLLLAIPSGLDYFVALEGASECML